ncbi:hypothetical protein NDU88_002672 [Pleurodeles waltl]|uniref:Uncharacterized protein n=1 Tax=Pleurodeles waltl TaxID=8319 RepID=A0AAV7W3G9_PLEWA|nr:hypothetical protein NDU88_002672 [Pleurodeles waltl]
MFTFTRASPPARRLPTASPGSIPLYSPGGAPGPQPDARCQEAPTSSPPQAGGSVQAWTPPNPCPHWWGDSSCFLKALTWPAASWWVGPPFPHVPGPPPLHRSTGLPVRRYFHLSRQAGCASALTSLQVPEWEYARSFFRLRRFWRFVRPDRPPCLSGRVCTSSDGPPDRGYLTQAAAPTACLVV